MDVRGALLHRLGDDRVHQLDDRRVFVGLLGQRALPRALPPPRPGIPVDEVFDRAFHPGEPVSSRAEVLDRGDRHAHPPAGDHRDVVDRQHVRRVGHRQQQRAVLGEPDGHGLVALGGLGGDQVHGAHVKVVDRQIEVIQSKPLGHHAGELVVAQHPHLDEHSPVGCPARGRLSRPPRRCRGRRSRGRRRLRRSSWRSARSCAPGTRPCPSCSCCARARLHAALRAGRRAHPRRRPGAGPRQRLALIPRVGEFRGDGVTIFPIRDLSASRVPVLTAVYRLKARKQGDSQTPAGTRAHISALPRAGAPKQAWRTSVHRHPQSRHPRDLLDTSEGPCPHRVR